jgi:hypothetical protein
MAKALYEFVEEVRKKLESFEKEWRENNIIDPENWPLVLDESNAGLWWEFFVGSNSEDIET